MQKDRFHRKIPVQKVWRRFPQNRRSFSYFVEISFRLLAPDFFLKIIASSKFLVYFWADKYFTGLFLKEITIKFHIFALKLTTIINKTGIKLNCRIGMLWLLNIWKLHAVFFAKSPENPSTLTVPFWHIFRLIFTNRWTKSLVFSQLRLSNSDYPFFL